MEYVWNDGSVCELEIVIASRLILCSLRVRVGVLLRVLRRRRNADRRPAAANDRLEGTLF